MRISYGSSDVCSSDLISPAGSIKKDGPAGKYLSEHGVAYADFNSYGARRGNNEVMMRGTFANIRLRNEMVPGTEGGITTYVPTGEIGRASCRERVCQSVSISVVAVSVNKQKKSNEIHTTTQ